MGMFLGLVGIAGFAYSCVAIIVQAIRRKPAKLFAILIACFMLCFIVGIVITPTPEKETGSSPNIGNKEPPKMESEVPEIINSDPPEILDTPKASENNRDAFFIGSHTGSQSDASQPIETGNIISINDIPNYRFGPVLLESFNSIGATGIVDAVCEVSNSHGTTFKVETDGAILWVSLKQSYSDEEWYVAWIKDYDSKKLYYCNESEKFTPSGLLKESIYSFETGEIVEQADIDAVEKYYNQLQEEQTKETEKREQQIREDASTLFHEIRAAYKNNELSADDTYKGNRYTIIGQFDGVSEDGIFNTLLNEINVTVKVMDGNTPCYVFCSFDADIWREKLTELNKGDEMIIEGECYSWGSWSDCELKS